MSPIDTINRVINMVSLVILLFYIVKTYRQVRSLDFLDYFVLYLKHRQTIYDEMQGIRRCDRSNCCHCLLVS